MDKEDTDETDIKQEEECPEASTPPQENQATQHRMDYYTLQEADPQASPADIKRAYREPALKGHPHKEPEESAEVTERIQESRTRAEKNPMESRA